MTTAPAHPWRRVVRTVFAWVTGIAPMIPLIVDAGDLSEATPGLAGALAISSTVTRLMGSPQVESFLRTYLPWLAAQDVAAEQVVAHVENGKVLAGEASIVPTGQEIKMPTVESAKRKPARRRRARDAGQANLDLLLLVLVLVIVLLLLFGVRVD